MKTKVPVKLLIRSALAAMVPTLVCVLFVMRMAGMAPIGNRPQMAALEEQEFAPEDSLSAPEERPSETASDEIGADEPEAGEWIEGSVYFTASLEESGRTGARPPGELYEQAGQKEIYLTFDDGPSVYTAQILDILAKYGVKATFFVVGRTDETSLAAYRRIVDEGHTLGMHSYSHRYYEIYRSVPDFSEDLRKLQELLYDTTGVWSRYYRFPGGSSNTVSRVDMQELIDYLAEQDIAYYDWNVSSGDAASGGISAQRIINNCLYGASDKSEAMILLHDLGDKYSTVLALPSVIEGIMAQGNVVFLPISDETASIQHIFY
ncbi:MAG: polysaccharide deacetylase [Lachnospiraceae bacterium]|jgi:peptidoglycan/xylan/chitin deacetylase (PgdA/CDA1 family)|nr:polysaccharide deacetylase [Lachnospiraceae bacterium]